MNDREKRSQSRKSMMWNLSNSVNHFISIIVCRLIWKMSDDRSVVGFYFECTYIVLYVLRINFEKKSHLIDVNSWICHISWMMKTKQTNPFFLSDFFIREIFSWWLNERHILTIWQTRELSYIRIIGSI